MPNPENDGSSEESPFYLGEMSRDLMERCFSECEKRHWHEALREVLGERYKEIIRYASDPTRTDWQYLLPLSPESCVLDLGAGWGANTFALAPRCKTVFALEKVAERVRFMEIRKRQDKVSNVVILDGDFHNLSLAASSIDIVICNGVLEWAAVEKEGRPRKVQVRFLEELGRVLKPNGVLLVGIANRFGLAAFRGAVDNSGFRYTSLMPRVMADAWARLVGGSSVLRGYRTYTYTPFGLRRLIEKADFHDVQVYAADESHSWPWNLMPLNAPGPRLYWMRQRGRTSRLIELARRLGLRKPEARLRNLLASYLVTVARKGNK